MTKAITTKELCDKDRLTQSVKGYENIPANAIVEYIGDIRNLYGANAKVLYNGILYYVDPTGLKFI